MSGNKVIFIFPSYPDVMYSFILSYAKLFEGEIEIICLKPLLQERKGLYESDELDNYARISFCPEGDEKNQFIDDVISNNRDAIFVFGGFLGTVGDVLRRYSASGYNKAIVVTEKPSIRPVKRFNWLVRLAKGIKAKLVYGKAYKHSEKSIQAVLVTGEKGVKQLQGYGVPKDKLYNFMYTHIDETFDERRHQIEDKVKFVYVGRFNYLSRGMDSLIYAFDKLSQMKWTLDLVGGYGENADEIIAWAEKKDNVSYIGSWKSDQVINNLQDYDICISPTRLDGWRIQVNQAILAGIGTITTEEAISDELVKKSNTGLVVDAFKPKKLYEAIQYVLDNPHVIDAWKENARKYSEFISNDRIAEYFDAIVKFSFGDDGKGKPRCPW